MSRAPARSASSPARFLVALALSVLLWIGCVSSASAHPFSLSVPSVDLSVTPQFNHLPVRISVESESPTFDLASLELLSDASWVSAAADVSRRQIVLSFATTNLISSSYTATITVRHGPDVRLLTVNAIVAPLTVAKLLDDPLRPLTYGLHQNSDQLGALVIFNRQSRRPIGSVTLGKNPAALALSQDGREFLALNRGDASISVVDLVDLIARKPIPLPRFDVVSSGFAPPALAIGLGNIIYYTDAADAPALIVMDRSTGQTIQTNYLTHPSNSEYGIGAFTLSPNKDTLYASAYRNWYYGSFLAKFNVAPSGLLTLVAQGDTFSSDDFGPEPVDAPLLLTADAERLFAKRIVVPRENLKVIQQRFPSAVYSITPFGELAASPDALFDANSGLKLADLPFTTTVQSISPDYQHLSAFDPNRRTIESISLSDLAPVGPMALAPMPAHGAITLPPKNLAWNSLPGAKRFRVYLGTSEAEVTSASTNSPFFLGEIDTTTLTLPAALAQGNTHFWRVDTVTDFDVLNGPVFRFTTAKISASASSFRIATVQGHKDSRLSLGLASEQPGLAWIASSDSPWVHFLPSTGTTPSNVQIRVDASSLAPGKHTASITISSGPEALFTVPVDLTVEPLRVKVLKSDPASVFAYALSENSTSTPTNAYLVEINTVTEMITRVTPVGVSAIDLAIQKADNRIYVLNSANNAILSVDRDTFRQVQRHIIPAASGLGKGTGISPGALDRLIIESDNGHLCLFSPVSNTVLHTSDRWPGGGMTDSTGRFYYHGDTYYSMSEVRKFDLSGDLLIQTRNEHYEGALSFGSATVVVSGDDRRIFWNGGVLDSQLKLEWNIGEVIYAASFDGRFAFGLSNVWDVTRQTLVTNYSGATPLKAFNLITEKLVFEATNSFGFFKLEDSPLLMPADNAIAAGVTDLRWDSVPTSEAYMVYLGANAAEVASADPSSSSYVGAVSTNRLALAQQLTAGVYYWRVDAKTPYGVIPGTVHRFTISPIIPHQVQVELVTVEGRAASYSVQLSSPLPGQTWTASTEDDWISLIQTNGSTPGELQFLISGDVAPGTLTGTIKLAGAPGHLFTLPVRALVEPLRLSIIKTVPNIPRAYAISEDTNASPSRAYLLEINTITEKIERLAAVGSSVTDLALHAAENRLYVANWRDGALRALDADNLRIIRTYQFRPGNPYTDRNVYRINPASTGRLVVESSTGNISLFDTVSGVSLTNVSASNGNGAVDDKGQFYYRGDAVLPCYIRKYDLSGDRITFISSRQFSGVSYYGSENVILSADNERIFWNGGMFDRDLQLQWNIGSEIYTLSPDSRLAFGQSNVWDVVSRSLLTNALPPSTVKAIDPVSQKLVYSRDGALGFLKLDNGTFNPVADAIVSGVQSLHWSSVPVADSYRVYLGRSAQEVVAADVSSPLFLEEITGNSYTLGTALPQGPHFWRVDAVTRFGVIPGAVLKFICSPVVPDQTQITAITFEGFPVAQTIRLSSPVPGKVWTASTEEPWISLAQTNGTSPGELVVTMGAGIAATNVVHGAIKVGNGSGELFSIPVKLVVESLRVTLLKPDPQSPLVYAISQNTAVTPSRAYLVEINSLSEKIERVVEVGSSVSDFAVHTAENRIYVANWAEGALRAVDRDSFRSVRTYRFTAGSSYSSGDVYHVSAATQGRLLIEGYNSGDLSLLDTVSGSAITTRPGSRGGGVCDPSGRFYYRGDTDVGAPAIRKFDLSGDSLAEVGSQRHFSAQPYGSRLVILSSDGQRLFWNGGVFNQSLDGEWNTGQEVYTASSDGRLAIGVSNVWDVVLKTPLDIPVPSTPLKAYSSVSQKLVSSLTNQFAFLRLRSGGSFGPGPGAVVCEVSHLQWDAVASADSYRIYLGANEYEVSVAGPSSPLMLGEVATNSFAPGQALAPGTYYWRVDTVTRFGEITGPVHRFTVAPVIADRTELSVVTFQNRPVESRIELSSLLPGQEWRASTDVAWISLRKTNGTTPTTLELLLTPDFPGPTNATGAITVSGTAGELFKVTVAFTVEPLQLTILRADPASELVYALSQSTNAMSSQAYLLEINSRTETIGRFLPLGSSATDLALHPAENRIYVADWNSGVLRAIDRSSFEQVRLYAFPPAYASGDLYQMTPGPLHRLVVMSYNSYLRLFDTESGSSITSRYNSYLGRVAADNSGRYCFFGPSMSSSAPRKFDLLDDTFNQVATGSTGGGATTLVVSPNGSRVFYGGVVYDRNLVEAWRIGDEIHAASFDGQFAFSRTNIYDVTRQQAIAGMPATTQISAYSDATEKLVVQTGNSLEFFTIGQPSLAKPVITAGPVSHASATLEWLDHSLEQQFRIQWRIVGETNIWTDALIPLNTTQHTVSGLSPDTVYEFRLRAEVGELASDWSDVLTLTTASPPPNPPTFYQPLLASSAVLLRWSTTVLYENFVLEKSATNSGNWRPLAVVPGNVFSFEDNDVVSRISYYYRIKGVTSTNESPFVLTQSALVPNPAPPATPSGVFAKSLGTNRLQISWTDVLGETGYILQRRTETIPWESVADVGPNTISFVDTNVIAGVEYVYRLLAYNSYGQSPFVGVVTAVPRNMVSIIADDFDPDLDGTAWSTISGAVALDGGKGFPASKVFWFGGADQRSASTVALPLAHEAYLDFKIRAGNRYLNATNYWDECETGETVVVEYSTSGDFWTTLKTIDTVFPSLSDWTSYTLTVPVGGLTSNTSFRWRQLKHSGRGLDTWAIDDVRVTTVAPQRPDAPTFVIASANSATAVAVFWSPVARATFYTVERSVTGQGWASLAALPATQNYFTDYEALPLTDYWYRVRAQNAGGDSPWSSPAPARTPSQQADWLAANAHVTGSLDTAVLAARGADGVPYLLKYAFNLAADEPLSNYQPGSGQSGAPAIWLDKAAGRLCVEFVRRKPASHPGLTYVVQFSDDATTWISVPPAELTQTSLDNPWERVRAEDSAPLGETSARFGRVLVIKDP